MRGIWVIAGKDLRNFFLSPLFYVVSGVCSLIWLVGFVRAIGEFIRASGYRLIQMGGQGEGLPLHYQVVYPHFSLVNIIMIFAASAITMRLFTEEKRNRTFDLLLTSPVTATEITVGKWLAGFLTALALIGIASLYPITLSLFGELEWGPLFSSIVGVALVTGCYIALGMFASSLTQSPVVAVILAMVFNLMLWLFGSLSGTVSDPKERAIWDYLDVGQQFVPFVKGSIGIANVVFFCSVIFLFTFLTQRVVESSRWR